MEPGRCLDCDKRIGGGSFCMACKDAEERRQNREEHDVAHTVDAEGFVVVDGSRVLDAKGNELKRRYTWQAMCQRCGGRGQVEKRLAVARRFERALGRIMYFHTSADPVTRDDMCPACADARRVA